RPLESTRANDPTGLAKYDGKAKSPDVGGCFAADSGKPVRRDLSAILGGHAIDVFEGFFDRTGVEAETRGFVFQDCFLSAQDNTAVRQVTSSWLSAHKHVSSSTFANHGFLSN